MSTQNKVSEPTILTANTYFWNPASSASARRNAENKRQTEVADFFTALGFTVTRNGDSVVAESGDLCAVFTYSESCANVYKHLVITRNGKRSNITAIRKLYTA